jgi:gamma-glutamylcyclotransferase (GGCT)/AIG2-like uncharacterized protein YtfP/superfamily II DNA or RNA helicase
VPSAEKTDPKPLFVYGDLRKGEKSHAQMRGSDYLGAVSTAEEYEKKPMGLTRGHASVKGELYRVSPDRLKKLDDFELDRYARSPVRLDGGEAAQAYMLKKTGGLLTRALVPLSSEARNVKPDDSEEGKAKADELRGIIAKKFNVSPYLAGSMATGLNLPGKYDYDYGVRVTSQPKFEKLVKRLEGSGTFTPSKYNKPGTDYHVFQGELGGVPVDLSVMYGDKGKIQREAIQAAKQKLDADEAKKLDLLKQKVVAKNLLAPIPVVGKKLLKTFKRETDADLGLMRFKREAIPGVEKGAEITEEQLRRLQRADVYGHRTSNLDPIISSGQLLSAAQAAQQGLLKDYEATGQRGVRTALDAPAKLRSEVFMTKGLLPAGEDYGRYGVLFEKKKARPSTYLNTIPQEHLHEGKWQSKLHYVVPDEEYETWAAKHPDAPILRESQVPESKRLAPKAGLGELAQRVLSGPSLFQKKVEVAPKLAEVATPLLPHQKRVVERIQQADQPGLLVAHGLGSGKTLTSIAAQDALGMPSTVILPAALQANYEKEREKHLAGERQPVSMLTLQAAARRGEAPANPLLVVDEAHRLREPSSKGLKAVKGTESQKRLLLTATPFYNAPSDIAPLINVVAGDKLLPEAKPEFEGQFVREREVKPGLWGRWMRHETPGLVREVNPKTAPQLQEVLHKYVDYHPSSVEGFPSVTREDVRVPMSRQQLKVYDTLMHEAPPWVAAKIKSGLPPSKQESQDLNAFLSGVRQVSNTTEGFQPGQDPHSPKIQAAFENLKKTLDANERAKAIVYSNYLESGIAPYKARLQAAGIPFGEFTGEMKKKDRDQMVKDYNEGKLRALLLSSAGGEGLDLKGTRLIQTLDPHWNIEKIRQVEGRGVRYGSHADLPEEERNVAIQRYLATRPASGVLERIGLKKPGGGVDEYLANMSEEKERLHEQFRKLLPGYEKKASMKPKGYYKGLPSDPEGVKFKVDFQGIEVRVERPKGFIMVGQDAKGVNWARRYKLDYGHIPKTLGGDGDGLDVFIGPDKKANEAFWAIQRKDDGTFDEYKVFLGFPDRDAAVAAYRQHIPKKYLKGVVTLKVPMMKAMLGKVEPEEIMKSACLASFMDELGWLERTSCA